ncbi:MAG: hypothetical protein H8D67_00135, partial [Deltaproteobacteria bacterium]|nr:hypothetical protein [Deltaproteobacteria bacterium]
MKPKNHLFLILLLSLSIHALAQKQPDNPNPINRDQMMIFDLSSLDWINAFDSLHAILEERYPFTEWKAIDWDQKKDLIRPKIEEAQNEGDPVKHTEALYEYLYSVPDGYTFVPKLFNFKSFATSDLASRIYFACDKNIIATNTHTVKQGERLDTIAGKMYGSGALWWV